MQGKTKRVKFPSNLIQLLLLAFLSTNLSSCIQQNAAVDEAFGGAGTGSKTGEIGNSAISFTPASYDFGSVAVGSSSSNYTVTLKNTTSSDLYISSYNLSSTQFSIVSNGCPSGSTTFQAKTTCTIVVKFTPTQGSSVTGTIIVSYGVASSNNSQFSSNMGLSGTGVGDLDFDGISSINNVTNRSMRLNWAANSDALSFVIYNMATGSPVYHSSVSNTSGTVVNATITGLTPSTSYTWRVRAVDLLGIQDTNTADITQATSANSSPSLAAIANPTAVTGVAVSGIDASDTNTGNDTDSDGDALTFTCYYDTTVDGSVAATNACATLTNADGSNPTFSSSTGVLSSWTPPVAALGTTFEFKITGTDPYSAASSVIFTALVVGGFTDDDGTAAGFAGGTHYGTQWDSTNNYLRLANANGCNALTNNCAEIDTSWAPQSASLTNYWKMNNDWNDSIGSKNGTASGATFSSSGKIGTYAGSFNGSNNYVDFTNRSSSGDITISAWIHPTSYAASPSHNPRILMNYDGTNDLQLILSESSKFVWGTTSGAAGAGTTTIPSLNVWTHVTVTRSGSTYAIYFDGIAQTITATTPGNPSPSTSTLRIGANIAGASSNGHFTGRIDDVAIWSTALTAAEIKTIYNRQMAKYSGQYTSRVMANGSAITWDGLRWLTTLPFGKELTGDANASNSITATDSETSSDYSSLVGSTGSTSDNNLMNSLKALWRFNETAATAGANNDFLDKSGNGYHAEASGGVTFGTPGIFDSAASFDGSTGKATLSSIITLNDNSDFTVSVWYKGTDTAQNSSWGKGLVSRNNGDLYANLILRSGYAEFLHYTTSWQHNIVSTTMVADGQWHHIVYTNYANETGDLWIDGVREVAGQSSAVGHATFHFRITEFMANYNSVYTSGQLDEVAVWTRALHASEVKQLYRRGANRLKFQVRSCTSSNCSDNPTWIGPDNTKNTYFSELHNYAPYNFDTNNCSATNLILTGSPSMLFACFTGALSNLASQAYFQYRAILESHDATTNCDYGSGATACSPELKSVEVEP